MAISLCVSLPSYAQTTSCALAPDAWVAVEEANDPIATSDFALAYADCSAFRNLGLAALRNQTATLIQALQDAENERRVLDHELRVSRTEKGMMAIELNRAVTETRYLRGLNDARLLALSAAQSEIDALSETRDRLNEANSTLSRDLASAREQESALRQEIRSLGSLIESLRALEAQTRGELIEALSDLQENTDYASFLEGELEKSKANVVTKTAQITDLERQLEGSKAKIAELETELGEAYRDAFLNRLLAEERLERIGELEFELGETRDQRDKFENDLSQARLENEQLKRRNTDLTTERDAQAMTITYLEGRIEDLENENRDLDAEVVRLRQQVDVLTQSNERLQADLDQLKGCIASVINTGDTLQVNTAETSEACKNLLEWAAVKGLENDKRDEVETQLAILIITNDGLASEIQQLTMAITQLEEQIDRLGQYRSRFVALISRIARDTPGIEVEGERARFTTQILFEPGSARLSRDGQARLRDVAEAMVLIAQSIPRDIGWIFAVEGHTDSDPINRHRRFQDNWDLAHGRAKAVVDYLVASEGIDPSWLSAAAFGEFQPIAANTTENGKGQNRRIEFGLVTYPAGRP